MAGRVSADLLSGGEQQMVAIDLVLALADRVFVLDRGHVVHQGPARPLLEDLEMRRRVLWV